MSTTTSAATSIDRILSSYIKAWNETDADRRRGLITATFSENASYVDPMVQSVGHDALDGMIAAVQERFAGLRFQLHGKHESHHDVLRFSWSLGAEGAEPLAIGTDVAVLADDGRMHSVTGFLDAYAGV
jgi:hypothetical protein